MNRVLIATAVLVAVLVAGCSSGTATAEIELVSPATAAEWVVEHGGQSDAVILDVRTPEEFSEGQLEGAVNVDFYDPAFRDMLAELDRDDQYLVYCRSGNRSASTVDMMRDLGFTSVTEIDGGILSWAQANQPVCVGC